MREPIAALVLALVSVTQTARANERDVTPSGVVESNAGAGLKLKSQGDRLLGELKYQEALSTYEKALVFGPNAAILYNEGRCLEALDRVAEAVQVYERFLNEAPAELRAKVPGLVDLVAKLKKTIAHLVVNSNVKGAKIALHDRIIGRTPLTAPIALKEGEGRLEVYADGYESARIAVTLKGGEVKIVDIPLRALTPSAPAHHTPSITTRWWFWTAVVGAVAGGIAVTIAATSERSPDEGTYGTKPGQLRW